MTGMLVGMTGTEGVGMAVEELDILLVGCSSSRYGYGWLASKDVPGLAAGDGGGDQRAGDGVRPVGEGDGSGLLFVSSTILSHSCARMVLLVGVGAYGLNGDSLGAGSQGGGLGAVGGVLGDNNGGVVVRVSTVGNSTNGEESGNGSEGELHFD
jgi:hypothetical protein